MTWCKRRFTGVTGRYWKTQQGRLACWPSSQAVPYTPQLYSTIPYPAQGLSNCLSYMKRVCAAVLILRVNLLFSPQVYSSWLLNCVHDKANLFGQQPKILKNSETKAAVILANYLTRGGSQPATVRYLSSPLPALAAPFRYHRGPANPTQAATGTTTWHTGTCSSRKRQLYPMSRGTFMSWKAWTCQDS